MKLSATLFSLLLLFGAAACGDDDDDTDVTVDTGDGDGDGDGDAAPTLSADVQPIFEGNCNTAGCHGSGSMASGVDLSSAQASYESLVQAETSADCEDADEFRVDEDDAEGSYLFDLLNGVGCEQAPQMPLGAQLDNEDKQTIIDWINAGAENN